MGKKIYINEQQLKALVKHIKGDKLNEAELLEEASARQWAMAGILTLMSMAGVAQDRLKDTDEGDVKHYVDAAEDVQAKLADESSDEYRLFSQVTKDVNSTHIETMKNLNPKDEKNIDVFKTGNLRAATSKVKHGGGMITDLVITRDTVWSDVPAPIEFDSTIETNIEGNLIKSGGFALNSDVAEELSFQFDAIKKSNSTLVDITINSSTDKEPLTKGLTQKLISNGYSGDNEGLSKARKDGIYNHLKKMGVDTSLIKLNIQWEQGPDVYSPDMSDTERTDAKALPGTSAARNVGVIWNVKKMLKGDDSQPVYKLLYSYMIEVTTIKEPLKGGYKKQRGGGTTTKKMKVPKLKLKGKTLSCELFGGKR